MFIEQRNAASQKIAENVDRAAARIREVLATIAGVSEFASQTRHGATQILQAVADLNRQATALQQGAMQFAGTVRAA